jgi:hypothetical protein
MFISLCYDDLFIILMTLVPVNIQARIIPTLTLVKIRSYGKKLDQYFLFPTLAPVNK